MEPKKANLEAVNTEVVAAEASAEADANLLDEGVSGRVSEMVGEDASESATGQSGATQQDDSKQGGPAISEKEMLRMELLKSAPAPEAMRREVLSKLEAKKNRIEVQLNRERKKANYYKVSILIRDLRSVLVMIERVAHASLEALKDFWLKVVHKFA